MKVPVALTLLLLILAVHATYSRAQTQAPAEPASSSSASAPGSPTKDSPYVPTGYKLTWSDEFDGTSLDTEKWSYRTDKKMGSDQVPENVSVADGKLILHLTYAPNNADGRPYAGAGVISKPTFKYGYYESRFKIPKAKGWHTSFWLQGYDGKGTGTGNTVQEIDICENDSKNPTKFAANLHKWSEPKKEFGAKGAKTPDLSADFHVWGCEFTPTEIKCYFDGKLIAKYNPAALGEPSLQSIWLTSISSANPKQQPNSMVPAELPDTAEYDYVRFYEKK